VCSARDLPVHAAFDGEAVRRAVLNLVANALRHSGSARIEVSAGREDDVLLVAVADHGRGIPARERAAIFEPFVRLAGSETTPGAGLGLAIVREIALAHGGSVTVRDRDHGPGAVFELRIPAPAANVAEATAREETPTRDEPIHRQEPAT
jgi:signal transduction histidine kinase